ncbi:hypothetical protein MMC26_006734 [Xylographa opegraphella]|nr:hypothetical protein [Xylographa opegraphella]
MQRLAQYAARRSYAGSKISGPLVTSQSLQSIKAFTTGRILKLRRGPGSHNTSRAPSRQKILEEEYLSRENLDDEDFLADELEQDEETGAEGIVDISTLGEDPEELRLRIARLEEELRDLRSGRSLSVFTPADRIKVTQALERARANGSKGLPQDESRFDSTSEELERLEAQYRRTQADLEIKFQLPPEHDIKLQSLTKALRRVATEIATNEPSIKSERELWRLYAICRQSVPNFLQLIPDKAWDILWESQYKAPGPIKDRIGHLKLLLEDMRASDRDLSATQRMVLIESLHIEGRHAEAISMWQQIRSSLRDNPDISEHCEDLGVRVYAAAGNPQKAQDLAFQYLKTRDEARTRILTPLIQAWAQRGDEYSIKQAWAIYLRLKMQLGSNMTLDDYDEITTCFLNTGRADIALAVFKDLMLTGQNSQYDSTELYKKSLGLYNQLNSQSLDVASATNVSLTALTILPRSFQNKFFFGSWLKKLLGMGQIDAAISVLSLMVERGVRADPKHLNGIVGALLRSSSSKNKERGIDIGRAMIEERLRFVSQRHSSPPTTGGMIAPPNNYSRYTLHERRIAVPPATIETFSLLLLYFSRRGMSGAIQQLQESLRAAEMPPNTYFMNHLLYASLRQGAHQDVWNLYLRMSPRPGPDLETFAALWDCEKAHLDYPAVRTEGKFPGPRHVFCDMVSWFSALSVSQRAAVRAEFSHDVYTQIIRCMCLAKDLEGTLVALYALHTSFGMTPDEDTSRMIALQVARMGELRLRATKRQRRSTVVKERGALNVEKVAQVVQLLAEEREEALQKRGIGGDDLSEEQVAAESIFLLAQLLRTFMESRGAGEEALREGVERAAWEMGCSGLEMGDPLLGVSRASAV